MILTGLARLGRDASLRYTQGGDPVLEMALAFNYGQKDGSGNKPTQWIEASLWGKRAESLKDYLKKGAAVDVILSDPHIETWQKKDQTTGFKLVGKVLELEFAGGAREAGANPSGGKSQPAADSPRRPAAPARSFDDLTDDVPF